MIALIGLGSNLGDRHRILREAARHLRDLPGIERLRLSHLYATPPWGGVEQPDYLNAIAEASTRLDSYQLLESLQGIERKLGRRETVRWGPREIDLDLLACGGEVIRDVRLTLPHPRVPERAFVLVPLCEIAPQWRDPLTGRTAVEMLEALDPRPEEAQLVGRFFENGEVSFDDAVGSDLSDD